jgi:hypothetical protein
MAKKRKHPKAEIAFKLAQAGDLAAQGKSQCLVLRSSLMEIESTPSTRLMMRKRTSSGCRVAAFSASASLSASARCCRTAWLGISDSNRRIRRRAT